MGGAEVTLQTSMGVGAHVGAIFGKCTLSQPKNALRWGSAKISEELPLLQITAGSSKSFHAHTHHKLLKDSDGPREATAGWGQGTRAWGSIQAPLLPSCVTWGGYFTFLCPGVLICETTG